MSETMEVTVTPLRQQQYGRATWEHIVIEAPGREQRFLCRGAWAGDTYFYFDTSGLVYERRPQGALETFEELGTGYVWMMCAGFELNTISGECARKVTP
jgi:hypothetical protein